MLFAGLGTFAKRVLSVAGGTAVGQGAIVLASPLLTRLYGPEDFGMLAAYTALIATIGVVGSWRYQTAIVLPKEQKDAVAVLGVSLALAVLTAGVAGIVLWAFGDRVVSLIDAPALRPYLWMIPAGALILAWVQALGTWVIRTEAFAVMGGAKATEGVTKAGIQLALAVVSSLGALGLLIGDVAGRGAGMLLLAWRSWTSGADALTRLPSGALGTVARRYRDFPLFAAPGTLLNTAGLQAPALLFASFYGLEVAGIFALGQRVIAMPMTLVGQAAAQVYLGEGGRRAREEPHRLRVMFAKTTKRLAIGGVAIALVSLVAPPVFGLIFGPEWVESGVFVRILGVTFALQFIVAPLSHTLNILERQRWQLAWDASRLVLVVGAITLAWSRAMPPRDAVLAYAIASGVAYVALHALGWAAITKTQIGSPEDR